MLHIGYHESASDGYEAMGREALGVGADTFAFFTRNPRGAKARSVDKDDAAALRAIALQNNFAPLVAHAPYTMNPCSAKPELRDLALEMLVDDLSRLSLAPRCFYNFHPGSHTGQGDEAGIALTAKAVARALKKVGGKSEVAVLIETMAGKGSEIGKTFEEIRALIDGVEAEYGAPLDGRLGVCMDTCHVWDAGYDIARDLDGVLAEFDKIVGLSRLRAVHLNDSMNDLGARKDRHQKLGLGRIGLDALSRVANHPALKNLPFILETPNDRDGYKKEIETMRALCARA